MGETIPAGETAETPFRLIPAEERVRLVRKALSGQSAASEFVPSEGGYLELPIISVTPDALAYRVDNGRILSELVAMSGNTGLSWEDVQEQAETQQVQSMLHKLLIAKAKDPAGPIFEEFERHAQQTAPLLIRYDGVVVNGNRRLAAMRELKATDPSRYAAFDRVSAAVLPEETSLEEQEYIEAALQMAPELKLEYGWINRRLKIRQHVQDLGIERILSAYRFKNREEAETELRELELAEAFLDWCGTPRAFEGLSDDEEFFVTFHAQLEALPDDYIRRVWRLIGFSMLKAKDELGSRIEHYFPFSDPEPSGLIQWVPRTMAEDRGLAERQAPGQNKAMNPRLVDRLVPLLDEPAQAVSIARNAVALIDTIKSDEKRILGANRAVHALRTARNALETLNSQDTTSDQLRNMRADLMALQEIVQSLSGGEVRKPTRDKLLPRIIHKISRLFGRGG